MTQNKLRLLPWSSTDGKPCYLSTTDSGGFLSCLADNAEAEQLGAATALLEHALKVLGNAETERDTLHFMANDMVGALRDVLSWQSAGDSA